MRLNMEVVHFGSSSSQIATCQYKRSTQSTLCMRPISRFRAAYAGDMHSNMLRIARLLLHMNGGVAQLRGMLLNRPERSVKPL